MTWPRLRGSPSARSVSAAFLRLAQHATPWTIGTSPVR